MLEVSVFTGREMFSGRWKQAGPLSSSDLRALAIVLIGAMSLVVVFEGGVDRGGSDAADGSGVCGADHEVGGADRTGGCAADFGAGALDEFVGECSARRGCCSGIGVWAIVTALAIAAVIGTIAEGTFGRTLGKARRRA